MIDYSNDKTNFLHKLLTNTQVSRIRKAFANGSSANIKFSKTHLSKMIQLGRSLFNLMDKLMGLALTFPPELVANKSIPKALLQTGNNLINTKIIKSSSL